jgi:hypothetical protein
VAADRIERRVWPYVLSSLLALLSIGALISTASGFTVLWIGLLGFACGAALALSLALSPLLSAPRDVPRVSAGMFTISYWSRCWCGADRRRVGRDRRGARGFAAHRRRGAARDRPDADAPVHTPGNTRRPLTQVCPTGIRAIASSWRARGSQPSTTSSVPVLITP